MPDIAKRVNAEHLILIDSPLPSLVPNSDADTSTVPFSAPSGIAVTQVAQVTRGAEVLEPAFQIVYSASAALYDGISFTIPFTAGAVNTLIPQYEFYLADSLPGMGSKLYVRTTLEYLNAGGSVISTFRTYSIDETGKPASAGFDFAPSSNNGGGDNSATVGDNPFKFCYMPVTTIDSNADRPSTVVSARITISFYDRIGTTPTKLTRTVYLTRLRAVWRTSYSGDLRANFIAVTGSAVTYRYSRGGDVSGVLDDIGAGTLTLTLFDASITPGAPYLRPGRRIYVGVRSASNGSSASWYGDLVSARTEVWSGFVTDVQVTYDGYKDPQKPHRPRVVITATDYKTKMEGLPAPYGVPGTLRQKANLAGINGFYLGSRDYYELSSRVNTDADAGEPSRGVTINSKSDGASLWDQYVLARNSFANAKLWVRGFRGITLQTIPPTSTPKMTFTDGVPSGVACSYADVELAYGTRLIVNTLTVKRTNVTEPDGSKAYGPFTSPRSVLRWGAVSTDVEIVDGDPTALARQYLGLYPDPKVFPRRVTISGYNTQAYANGAGFLELYDPVRIVHSGAGVDVMAWVIGIDASVTRERWTITYTVRPMEAAGPVAATNSSGVNLGPADVALASGNATEIPNAADLNTYVLPGIYSQTSTAEAVAGVNYPAPLAGLLEVSANTDQSIIWHRFSAYDNSGTYVRSYYGGAWSTWGRARISETRELGPGIDLDTVQAVGTYAQSVTTFPLTGLHYPISGASGVGMLSVERLADGSKFWQRYVTNAGRQFVRAFSGGAWAAWTEAGGGSASAVVFTPGGSLASTNVQDALLELDGDATVPQPAANRYKNADQAVTTATWTDITLQTETFAAVGITYSAPTFTVPKVGRYLIAGAIRWASSTTGARLAGIVVNGTAVHRESVAGGGSDTSVTVVTVLKLAASDAVKLQGYQASGGNLNARTTENGTFLALTYLGP